MVKKKDLEFIAPQLTPGEYWEWRTTLAEMESARHKLDLNEARLKIIQKDVELSMSKAQLHSATAVRSSNEALDAAKSEYQRFKKVLELRLGQTLDNTVIDDVTFEVKILESSTSK